MHRFLPRLVLLLSAAQTALLADEVIKPLEPELGRDVDFYQDVYPILQAKCLACHNAAVKESELVLETAESIVKGGVSGEGVNPGQPDESLIYWVATREEEPVMPPLPNDMQAKPLTPRELGILRRWIREGAKGGVQQVDTELNWQAIPVEYPAVYSLAMFPGEQYLAAGRGNRVFIYDLVVGQEAARLTDPSLQALQREGEPLYGPGVAHRDFVHSLAVNPAGNLLASGGYRVVKLWERQPLAGLADMKLPAPVIHTALDAECRWAAFVLATNEVRLWNLVNGSAGTVIPPSDWSVTGVVFSSGGESIITAGESGRIRMWGIDDGRQLSEMKTPQPITALAIWREGGQLLTAHADNIIRAWRLPENNQPLLDQPVREFRGHDQPVTSLVVAHERSEVVSAGRDQSLRIWNLKDGKQLFQQKTDAAIASIGIGAAGERIIIADENRVARIFDRKGECVGEIKGNMKHGRRVEQRTDELAVAKEQFNVVASSIETAEEDIKEREKALAEAHEEREKAEKAIPPAQEKLDTARKNAREAQAKKDEHPDDDELKQATERADETRAKAQLALEKAKVALVSAERMVELSDEAVQTIKATLDKRTAERSTAEARQKQAEESLQSARRELDKSNRVIQSIATFADRQMFLTAGDDQPIQLWQADSGQPVGIVDLPETKPTHVLMTATGALLTVDVDNNAALWDVTPRWVMAGVLGPKAESGLDLSGSAIKDRVTALAFSPDGTLLATGGGEPTRGGELMLWDVKQRRLHREIADAHSDTIFSVKFSRDGRQLVSGSADRFVKLFNVKDGSLVRSFEGHSDHVLAVTLKADGNTLATGGADKAIKIWDIATGEQRRTIDNYAAQVTSLDFVGISDNLVSSSGDKKVKFHLAANGKNLRTFSGSRDYVYAALATDQKGWVIAAGEDGVVRIWNAEDGTLIKSFDPPPPTTETTNPAD